MDFQNKIDVQYSMFFFAPFDLFYAKKTKETSKTLLDFKDVNEIIKDIIVVYIRYI